MFLFGWVLVFDLRGKQANTTILSTQQYIVVLDFLFMPTALTNCTVHAAYTTEQETPEGCTLWEFSKQLLSRERRQSEGSV